MVSLDMSMTTVVVTDSKLYGRTGDVGRWARSVNVAFVANAKKEAPSGLDPGGRKNKSPQNLAYPPGSLRESIEGDVQRVGVRHLQTIVSVNVPYALYVIKGTSTIRAKIPRGEGGRFAERGSLRDPDADWGMFIPANFGYPNMRRAVVSGQGANDFLGRAFSATSRRHSSLRGFDMVGTL